MPDDKRGAAALRNFEETPTALALCFGGVFLVALLLRLHGISAKPFWMDEVTTINRASLPLGALVKDSLFFHQLPAFFVVTSWVLPFGTDEFWVRLPPAFFGALSCALGFGIARSLGGLKAGLATGLLMALSPAMVQYGQEARSYTMVISAILVGLWGLVILAQDGKSPFHAWAAYVLGTVAALNILSVALFWLLAANLAGIVVAWRKDKAFRNRWLLAQLLILLLCAPWFIAIKMHGQRGPLGGLDWVPPLNWARVWWAFSGTYLLYVTSLIKVRVFAPGIAGIGVLVVLLAVAGLLAVRRQRGVLAVLSIAVLCLPTGLLAASAVTPLLMPRYLLWSAAPFFICAGLGFSLLPRKFQWPALALLFLLLALNLAPYYREETKPRWDLAGASLFAGLQPGDLLLVDDPQAVSMMNLYLKREGANLPPELWTTDVTRAVAWRESGKRVWAVQGVVGQVDHENQAQFLQRITALGPPDFSEHAGMDILLLRFDGAPAKQQRPVLENWPLFNR
jgi:mannosyltransferase